MPLELKVLGWSICLGFVHVFTAGAMATRQRGLQWNMGNRDGAVEPLMGAAARAVRASQNFLETFPFFAAAVLAAAVQPVHAPGAALGAELYFWARVAYLPIYILGVPYVRTVVFGVSVWGIVKVLGAWL